MSLQKLSFSLAFVFAASAANAQDSLNVHNPKPEHPHELGISIATPICLLMGASDFSGRFTNLTYRHWLSGKHNVKAFVGTNFMKETDPYSQPNNSGIIPTTQELVYSTKITTTPTNFQIGLGYEYMKGGKFKHGPGIDIVYNNVFEKTEYFDMKVYQTIGKDSIRTDHYDRLEAGAYVKGVTITKIGFNLSYSLRYQMAKHWVLTASAMGSFRLETRNESLGKIHNFDFNIVGIVSDISLFYRF
ncbi:MAG: hypothetical protein PSX36_01255 [bacterium]|nr:hypothetical protein [bacterium]